MHSSMLTDGSGGAVWAGGVHAVPASMLNGGCGARLFWQVVSGLAKHMPLEALAGARVVLVANLKLANMRGVKSQAMVLAATSPDGSKAGALVTE